MNRRRKFVLIKQTSLVMMVNLDDMKGIEKSRTSWRLEDTVRSAAMRSTFCEGKQKFLLSKRNSLDLKQQPILQYF